MSSDKIKHIVLSYALCIALSFLFPAWGAMLLTAMIGIAKELIWDKWLKNGSPEFDDFLADLVGIALADFSIEIFKMLYIIAVISF